MFDRISSYLADVYKAVGQFLGAWPVSDAGRAIFDRHLGTGLEEVLQPKLMTDLKFQPSPKYVESAAGEVTLVQKGPQPFPEGSVWRGGRNNPTHDDIVQHMAADLEIPIEHALARVQSPDADDLAYLRSLSQQFGGAELYYAQRGDYDTLISETPPRLTGEEAVAWHNLTPEEDWFAEGPKVVQGYRGAHPRRSSAGAGAVYSSREVHFASKFSGYGREEHGGFTQGVLHRVTLHTDQPYVIDTPEKFAKLAVVSTVDLMSEWEAAILAGDGNPLHDFVVRILSGQMKGNTHGGGWPTEARHNAQQRVLRSLSTPTSWQEEAVELLLDHALVTDELLLDHVDGLTEGMTYRAALKAVADDPDALRLVQADFNSLMDPRAMHGFVQYVDRTTERAFQAGQRGQWGVDEQQVNWLKDQGFDAVISPYDNRTQQTGPMMMSLDPDKVVYDGGLTMSTAQINTAIREGRRVPDQVMADWEDTLVPLQNATHYNTGKPLVGTGHVASPARIGDIGSPGLETPSVRRRSSRVPLDAWNRLNEINAAHASDRLEGGIRLLNQTEGAADFKAEVGFTDVDDSGKVTLNQDAIDDYGDLVTGSLEDTGRQFDEPIDQVLGRLSEDWMKLIVATAAGLSPNSEALDAVKLRQWSEALGPDAAMAEMMKVARKSLDPDNDSDKVAAFVGALAPLRAGYRAMHYEEVLAGLRVSDLVSDQLNYHYHMFDPRARASMERLGLIQKPRVKGDPVSTRAPFSMARRRAM